MNSSNLGMVAYYDYCLVTPSVLISIPQRILRTPPFPKGKELSRSGLALWLICRAWWMALAPGLCGIARRRPFTVCFQTDQKALR
jgi:hypothetical protein